MISYWYVVHFIQLYKGQLISKATYGLLTSPKKRTDEFDLFAFLLFKANKFGSCTSCFPVGYSYWLKETVESLNFCIGFSHESTFVCNEEVHGLPFAFHSNFQENLGAKSTSRQGRRYIKTEHSILIVAIFRGPTKILFTERYFRIFVYCK